MTTPTAAVLGRIEQIWIYPVRSLGGTSVSGAEVGPLGLAGDRAYTVVGADGAPLRGKDAPGLSAVAATGDPARDERAVRQALGAPVRLAATGPAHGTAAVHLVSREAVRRAAAGEVPAGCSADAPRANLLLALTGAERDERAWVGRRLRVGTAVLEITRLPKHCLGVYAEVLEPGAVRTGDEVHLLA